MQNMCFTVCSVVNNLLSLLKQLVVINDISEIKN